MNKTAFYEEIYIKPQKKVWYKSVEFGVSVLVVTLILLGIII